MKKRWSHRHLYGVQKVGRILFYLLSVCAVVCYWAGREGVLKNPVCYLLEQREPKESPFLWALHSVALFQGVDIGEETLRQTELFEKMQEENRSYQEQREIDSDEVKIQEPGEQKPRENQEEAAEAGNRRLPVYMVSGGIEKKKEEADLAEPVLAGSFVPFSELIHKKEFLATYFESGVLLKEYYIVDNVTSAAPSLFDPEELLNTDLTITPDKEKYQILIYHTHASEEFCDSRAGVEEDTVRGPGEKLAQCLRAYGYGVYHDMTAYDRKNGEDNRNYAYSTARPKIEQFLKEHPEVEVIIDLHRDSGAKRTWNYQGEEVAKIMLFNGLCRNANGPMKDLENPNLKQNLAFSLQVNLAGRALYPGMMYKIYLKNYRYNEHFRERYLLVELGTEENTVAQAYGAMPPFAEAIHSVLSGGVTAK